MFTIDANTLYSKDELASLLEPLSLSVEAFLDKLRPRKKFKSVYWGQDLIDALNAEPESEPAPVKRKSAKIHTLKPRSNRRPNHAQQAEEMKRAIR